MAQKLGEILIRAGVITEEQLNQALAEQKRSGGRLGSVLINLGFAAEEEITEYLGKQYGVPAVNLTEQEIDRSVLRLIPATVAEKYEVIPFSRDGKTINVVMANPANLFAIEDIKFTTGFEVRPMVAAEHSIKRAIEQYYHHQAVLDRVMSEMEKTEGVEVLEDKKEEEGGDLAAQVQSGPVVQLVNKILTDGVDKQVSDIQIEPYEKEMKVRYRIDGILHEVMKPPFNLRKAIISRIKIMSKLKIAEKRLPQDGRISVKIRGKPIDFRISTIPTMWGEKVSLRVLDRSIVSFDLGILGFDEEALLHYNQAIINPYGIVLVTGPTGCGKTTTLYATLSKINSPGVNIITAEDPVEYSLLGVNQVQMKEQVGLNFVSALRSYVRQDPDIIMVGEIRDHETAEIAIRASLTGHLVLSTVHTNSAPATITRLINMGVEPFLIACTLILVESQRLVKKTCTHCREPQKMAPEYLKSLGVDPGDLDGATLYKGRGCSHCHSTGYRGRTGIFEVMPITAKIRELILDRASTDELTDEAEREGMIPLRKAALSKLKKGIIDLDELARETVER